MGKLTLVLREEKTRFRCVLLLEKFNFYKQSSLYNSLSDYYNIVHSTPSRKIFFKLYTSDLYSSPHFIHVERNCSNPDCAQMTGSDDIEMGFWMNKVFRLQCIGEVQFFISPVIGCFFRSKKKKKKQRWFIVDELNVIYLGELMF